jgi:hypothetical protein
MAFDAYLKDPNIFKSNFGNDKLKEYFIFLRGVEKKQGNEQRVKLIDQVLSQL